MKKVLMIIVCAILMASCGAKNPIEGKWSVVTNYGQTSSFEFTKDEVSYTTGGKNYSGSYVIYTGKEAEGKVEATEDEAKEKLNYDEGQIVYIELTIDDDTKTMAGILGEDKGLFVYDREAYLIFERQ